MVLLFRYNQAAMCSCWVTETWILPYHPKSQKPFWRRLMMVVPQHQLFVAWCMMEHYMYIDMVWHHPHFDRNNPFWPKHVKFKHSADLKFWTLNSPNSFRRLKHALKLPSLNYQSIHMHHDMVWLKTKNSQFWLKPSIPKRPQSSSLSSLTRIQNRPILTYK